jgi:4-hydroxybenzoate polyprenyltransferase
MTGAVYILNDIADVTSDRKHPIKKFRPIASGEIKIPLAVLLALLLILLVVVSAVNQNYKFNLALLSYFIVNIAYTYKLKHVVLLDIFSIAFGFMIRIIAGAWIVNIEVSSWLILCTLFLSLFLAITKRRSEINLVEGQNLNDTRKVLSDYSVIFADQMSTIAASGAVISYALYTVSERTREIFHTENLIFTTPFVVFGIFRYLFLVHKKNLGENPTAIVTTDIPMIINLFLWLLSAILIIYKTKFSATL